MAKPIFDWGKDDFNFNVPVYIEGDLSLTGDIEIGGVSLKTLLGLGGKNGNFGNYTDVWCAISYYWFRHLVN